MPEHPNIKLTTKPGRKEGIDAASGEVDIFPIKAPARPARRFEYGLEIDAAHTTDPLAGLSCEVQMFKGDTWEMQSRFTWRGGTPGDPSSATPLIGRPNRYGSHEDFRVVVSVDKPMRYNFVVTPS